MNLMYYIPGGEITRAAEALAASALDHLGLGDGPLAAHLGRWDKGPDGGPGLAINPDPTAAGGEAQSGLFLPDRQEWTAAPKLVGPDPLKDRVPHWIGRDRHAGPRPADLQRKTIIDGDEVVLGDGQSWIVPQAVDWPAARTRFPTVLRIDDDGAWKREPREKYRRLCGFGDDLAATILGGGTLNQPEDVMIELAVEILAVNYRVSAVECSMLSLLTTGGDGGTVAAILAGFSGVAELRRILADMEEAAKKNGPASIPATSGSSAGGPD